MLHRKIALIGHSGSGKSECLKRLAEMDSALGTNESPSLQDAVNWMAGTPCVVVVGVHKELLRNIPRAKATKEHGENPGPLFVYLYMRKDKLEKCLNRDVQKGRREASNARAALSDYEELDGIFRRVADYIIDTSALEIDQVADEIRHLSIDIIRP